MLCGCARNGTNNLVCAKQKMYCEEGEAGDDVAEMLGLIRCRNLLLSVWCCASEASLTFGSRLLLCLCWWPAVGL